MANKKQIVYRAFFYLLIVCTAACAVTASCLLSRFPTASYCLYGGAGAALLGQLLLAICGVFSKFGGKLFGFEQWATSLEVVLVCVLFVVLSPILLILCVVAAIREYTLSHHRKATK